MKHLLNTNYTKVTLNIFAFIIEPAPTEDPNEVKLPSIQWL